MNNAAYNALARGAGGAGSSSSVTDAGLMLPGTPNIPRSTSVSNMRIPTSPMSFSSNNMNMPSSSILDGSAAMQPNPQPQQQQQQQLEGASKVTSLPIHPSGQASVPMAPSNIGHVDKKPRIEVKQEDLLQQQVLQQLLQRQDPMGRNPQLQALLQQQRLRQQQQQLLQSMSPSQRLQLQQQQQQQLRQQLQQQGMQQIPPNVRPFEGGVCARRLMMYLYHQQQRPENCISYWRKFVAEYYSPRAKQRLCLSQYDSAGHHALGMFSQPAPDIWHCDLCGTKSGRGFEASFDVLARLNEIKFGSGIIDELLYLDYPRESRFPSGLMMLEYRKAVQESVHEQFRVVREGHLRIIFTQDLKILSWEFCARRHEELFLRRLVAPQVNQLVQVAQKCQSTISESGSESVSQLDLQSNSNMVLAAGRQLVKFLELQSLNDLGYPKRYIRTLQIAEVVKSMKDLMNFSGEHEIGPIEGLKRLSEQTVAAKLQRQKMQEMEHLVNSAPNSQMALPQGMMMMTSPTNSSNSNSNNHNQMVGGRGALSGSAQAAMALTNYQSMLMRQNGMNGNAVQPPPFLNQSPTNSNPSPSSSALQRQNQNLPMAGFSSPQQHRTINTSATANMVQQNHHLQQGNNQSLQEQQMMRQLLQEMSSNNGGGGGGQRSFSGQNGNATPSSSNVSGGGGGVSSRSNSFKGASNNNNNSQRTLDLPQNLHLPEDDITVPELPHDFTDDEFFNNNDLFGL
ncbi:PREDICTED: probable transcriptional regulator SLK3 [Tarenaya hassleriana]|uniref:probable transcriptional regulator SLK3 n=1 Tax=Tarenaya hassleriana TaxID=28532 RepID=UPI00053C8D83|nr:PREDICTED: probable transcriptional regulator SLK3 [Tarenaya hassleriana]